MKILFICTGNTCRSPIAEIVAKEIIPEIFFDSAGVFASKGDEISVYAMEVLKEKNYEIKDFHSKRVSPEILKASKLILTMTREQKEILKSFFIEENDKIYTLKEYNNKKDFHYDILDPFGGDLETYRKVFQEIENEIKELRIKLKENN